MPTHNTEFSAHAGDLSNIGKTALETFTVSFSFRTRGRGDPGRHTIDSRHLTGFPAISRGDPVTVILTKPQSFSTRGGEKHHMKGILTAIE